MDPAGFEPAGLSLRSGFRLQAPASLTPAKRLNFDRELCYRCTTGPVGSLASRGDRCKDASHNSFDRFQIAKAGQHAKMTWTSRLSPSFSSSSFQPQKSFAAGGIGGPLLKKREK